ncbi:MAG: type II toxin-antitoxin system RelE/ParE family toxin [Thermoplasmata archaeon]|nr:type II toxin-antitoxin system RelE/ParE family toxin [Thermoplasmata archaeon]
MFRILVSRTFQKQFGDLPENMQKRIRNGLNELERDPFNSRSGADIKSLKDTDPPKHRMRIGEYRLIYHVDDLTVMLIEIFIRGRGHRE